jgi:hypothetical protein
MDFLYNLLERMSRATVLVEGSVVTIFPRLNYRGNLERSDAVYLESGITTH